MKHAFVIFILILSVSLYAQASQKSVQPEFNKSTFISGEQLTYRLHYGFIEGGKATLSVSEKTFAGKKVFHARAYAKTTGLTNRLFPLEDVYESYFDKHNGLPYKAIRNISEGGYRYYSEDFFLSEDTTVYNKKQGRTKVPAGTLDMISSLYYLRNINTDTLVKGDVVNFTTYFADEIFPFYLRYKGKEIVTTDFGKIRCLRFDPVVEPGRIFKSEDDMSFWITDDANMIPVLVEFEMIVGYVKCELIDYKNLKTSINWQKK